MNMRAIERVIQLEQKEVLYLQYENIVQSMKIVILTDQIEVILLQKVQMMKLLQVLLV
jgi:hypothetical protein